MLIIGANSAIFKSPQAINARLVVALVDTELGAHICKEGHKKRKVAVLPGFSNNGLLIRLLAGALFLFLGQATVAEPVTASQELAPLPGFAELEASGAIIGEIRINNQDIFDLTDPKEDNALFRQANKLHIQTRPEVIRGKLLFKSGDLLIKRLIDESERLLRSNRFLYDVVIRPSKIHDGVVDIEVMTRDTWTLNPGVSFSRAGGSNSSGITLAELNLLGTGTSLSYGQKSNIDRSGRELSLGLQHAFDGRTAINYTRLTNSDGRLHLLNVDHPFYALDTRWAAGAKITDDNRIDSIYSGGASIGQYRTSSRELEAYYGWSGGLENGWVNRWSIGTLWRDNHYSLEPELPAPPLLPGDDKLVAPFLRHEIIEDDYTKRINRNQIGRPELFQMGFSALTTVYRGTTALGSQRNQWMINTGLSNGFVPAEADELLTTINLSSNFSDQKLERQAAGTALSYYHPHDKRTLFVAVLNADLIRRGADTDVLQLGGDNGLRGFPLRYQSGTNRVLVTIEDRMYTDWFPFRLFRVGGAIFLDHGRAWGGNAPSPTSDRWLSDVGLGLRVSSVRSAFGNVLHIDFAFPINPDAGIKRSQFLVKTKLSF